MTAERDSDDGARAIPSHLVLLVDDDPVGRLLTAAALTERGWRVIEAADGREALELYAERHPDVVVLDALMPGMDGFAACRALRADTVGAHVPVLMLTGLEDEGSIAAAYEAGATDFFVKTASQWTLLSERLRYLIRAARLRAELAASRAKLSKAHRIARLGSWEWDVAARTVKLSDECFDIAGITPQAEALPAQAVWHRLVEADRSALGVLFEQALAGTGPIQGECRIVRPGGQLRVVRLEAELDRDDGGRPRSVHGVVQDVTERKQAEDQIRQLANYDSLTGLPNRRSFRDQFQAALERARQDDTHVGVLFIDIDRFKQVNDTLGHQVGDQLLREVARRLYRCLRSHDTVGRPGGSAALLPATATGSVARLGGDEFTVLLTGLADAADIDPVAQRLLETLRAPVQCAGHELFATASIGVASFPTDGRDVETLLRKADIAMYAAKDRGRNAVLRYVDSMSAASTDRWRIETALHRALERQELVLHYQPKVDVRSGAVVGAEALMRWVRNGVLVPPAEFIPVAEESGLIVPITEWAVREVCRQLVEWGSAGAHQVPVSVNISGRHLQRASLLLPVQNALSEYGLDAGLLELELTETVLMQDLSNALPLLQALKALGTAISVDDFGTGYSSLAYLRRLPIDTLKIDRSFVRDLETSDDSAAIVGAIIAMSRSLKLRVVAEGVETAGQCARLVEQGCHLMQGFLFARPMPGQQFAPLLRHGRGRSAWRVPAEPATVTASVPAAAALPPTATLHAAPAARPGNST